ncbi:MAG: SLBB domain-containing protein, partial [Chloroflexi bacterium]|nr:SLBB domain-containing protein [Chloroflexota bacterium]
MDGWTKVRYLAIALLIATSVVAFACHRSQSPPVTTPPPPVTEARVKPPTPTVPTTVKVHVAGAVVTPGVYEVSRDARVEDAVRAAGGLTDTADLSRVNLAEHVRDGKKIDVPTLTPRPEGDSGSPSPTGDGGPWD